MPECYQMIADENELRWFFDHCLIKPSINESYSAVFVCRHKKLSAEEFKGLGIAKHESEFIATQVFRNHLITDHDGKVDWENSSWEFNRFLKTLRRFNVDKGAYITDLGYPIPEKALVIVFYINPCNDIKVADKICETITNAKTAIVSAVLDGKEASQLYSQYQVFSKLDSQIKHYKANCKGSRYWIDFDIDVPDWFKPVSISDGFVDYRNEHPSFTTSELIQSWDDLIIHRNRYYNLMYDALIDLFGKKNFVVISTGGGFHVLVRTSAVHVPPNVFCDRVHKIYETGIQEGNKEYINEKGMCKFECNLNDSQIPGIPMPGTLQYGRPVTILNKEDFKDE